MSDTLQKPRKPSRMVQKLNLTPEEFTKYTGHLPIEQQEALRKVIFDYVPYSQAGCGQTKHAIYEQLRRIDERKNG